MSYKNVTFIIIAIGAIALSINFKTNNNLLKKKNSQLEAQKDKLLKELILSKLNKDENGLIVKLRDLVYSKTVIGREDRSQSRIDVIIDLINGKKKMLCGGMAQTYKVLLSIFGIPSRTIQLADKKFVDGLSRGNTHVTVEVYDKDANKWYVSDPTFNVSFSCKNNKGLSNLIEMRKCGNKNFKIVRNGSTYIKRRLIENYYLPYTSLLFAAYAKKVSTTSNGKRVSINEVDLPHKDWLKSSINKYKNKVTY